MIKDRQPGSHTVRHLPDKAGIHLVVVQLTHHIASDGRIIHQAHKGGPQLAVGNILRHVSGNTAVDLLHTACIASRGNVIPLRVSFDVHKNRSDDNNSHCVFPFPVYGLILIPLYKENAVLQCFRDHAPLRKEKLRAFRWTKGPECGIF